MKGKKATEEMIRQAQPPVGYEPILSNSPFGWGNGPIFERTLDDGSWVRGFRVAEKHANVAGMCHGGMLMTFADIFVSKAVLLVAAAPFVTLRLTTDFVTGARVGDWLEGRATATLTEQDDLVAVEGAMHVGETPIATCSGLFKTFGNRG